MCVKKHPVYHTFGDKSSNRIVEDEYEDLNKGRRELILFEIPALKEASMEPKQFWYAVGKEKCGDDLQFPKISKHVKLAVSASFLCCGGKDLNGENNKTKHRSRLQTETLKAILHSKALLKAIVCKNWQPPTELVKWTATEEKKNNGKFNLLNFYVLFSFGTFWWFSLVRLIKVEWCTRWSMHLPLGMVSVSLQGVIVWVPTCMVG